MVSLLVAMSTLCSSLWTIAIIKTPEMSVWAKFAKICSREHLYLYNNVKNSVLYNIKFCFVIKSKADLYLQKALLYLSPTKRNCLQRVHVDLFVIFGINLNSLVLSHMWHGFKLELLWACGRISAKVFNQPHGKLLESAFNVLFNGTGVKRDIYFDKWMCSGSGSDKKKKWPFVYSWTGLVGSSQ